ncbi:endoglucanase E-4-like [Homarus americanus]|uniref:endoglucanase E-4-like n=1 Tax=Homarus americanus TaxID=6706 RepID=UPI001C451D65|nr:endoglucanase E-4-like [Homarus americanus]
MTGVLVKTCLLGALALTLLQTAEAQCPEVVITNEWDGNYQADFIVEAPADSNGISLDLTFSSPVDSIEFWAGSVTKTDDTHFTLVDSKTDVHEGDQIKFSFQVHFSASKPYVITEVLNGLEICDTIYTTPAPPSTPEPLANPCDATDMKPYDYSQVLCMSYVFYEAQRSGPLPADQRVTWRGDSALDDGSDVGHDLTGGYYDAGDFVKFGFPMAYTATVLGWGLIDFAEGHEAAGQLEYGQAALKWATDYFLKANTGKNEFYGQVGSGQKDHAYWGRPEDMDMERPAWKIDEAAPGTELAAETAAALAAAAMVFKENDPDYSAEVLDVAKELYDFADKFRLTYDKSIPDASAYYHSWSGFGDELCWAALWLARATGEDTYLTRARGHWEEFHLGKDAVLQFSWDDKRAGVFELFWLLDGSQEYLDALNKYLDWLKDGATYTPEGLVFLDSWGANRHAANVAFISLWAAKNGINTEANREWAAGQVDQLLGANSRLKMSFVVGYGDKYPERPHHRSSSCPWPPKVCDYTWAYSQDGPNPHVLYGALVGGPSQNGDYKDDREDFTHNEVACDYNAAFSGALAAMVELN